MQCTKSRACHAKATGRAAETKGHRRDTGGTPEGHRRDTGGTPEKHPGAYIRPLCSAPSLTPATQKTGGTPEGHRRDTGAYIRPRMMRECV